MTNDSNLKPDRKLSRGDRLINWVTDAPVSGTDKLVMLALSRSVGKNSERKGGTFLVWPGKGEIASRCGLGRTTVYESLKRLQELGYIEQSVRRKDGYRESHEYLLLKVPCSAPEHGHVRLPNTPCSAPADEGGSVKGTQEKGDFAGDPAEASPEISVIPFGEKERKFLKSTYALTCTNAKEGKQRKDFRQKLDEVLTDTGFTVEEAESWVVLEWKLYRMVSEKGMNFWNSPATPSPGYALRTVKTVPDFLQAVTEADAPAKTIVDATDITASDCNPDIFSKPINYELLDIFKEEAA